MTASIRVVLFTLLLGSSLLAQRAFPRFSAGIGLAGGSLEHVTDGSNLDGDTDAGLFRLRFEALSNHGIGGGVRLDVSASDDDLFADNGFNGNEARTTSFYGHFTYRVGRGRFQMPVRIGLLLHSHVLEERLTGDEGSYTSFGPQFEVAPEVFLVRRENFAWTLQSTFSLGVGATFIDFDGDSETFVSSTLFYGAEFGTRFYVGPVDFGISYVYRGHDMAESDIENGMIAYGYDSSFEGVMFTFGASF